jgi:hypothetical protein
MPLSSLPHFVNHPSTPVVIAPSVWNIACLKSKTINLAKVLASLNTVTGIISKPNVFDVILSVS